jgi:hypothetical protein
MIKHFMSVLKKIETNKHLDNFVLDMDPNAEKLVMRVFLKNGINKLYRLPFTDILANSLPRLVQLNRNSGYLIGLMARPLWDALNIAGKDAQEVGLKLNSYFSLSIFSSVYGHRRRMFFFTRSSWCHTETTSGEKL